ncbi:MAG TPA: MerR family transcriptional regulator [Chloroflexota bacterium]
MPSLRPVDLGRSVGISAQTVRKYERFGFLPPAERAQTGYRRYTPRHLAALRTARTLIAGYGWQQALQVLQFVHSGDLTAAHAAVDAAHPALHHERQQLETMLSALRASAVAPPSLAASTPATTMLIGEAARLVGVRVSAVRFWEQQALLQPLRDPNSRYRRYSPEHLRDLQVVVLLRQAGYAFAAIRAVLEQLRSGQPEQAVLAAERRLAALTAQSQRRMAGTAALWDYLTAATQSEQSAL